MSFFVNSNVDLIPVVVLIHGTGPVGIDCGARLRCLMALLMSLSGEGPVACEWLDLIFQLRSFQQFEELIELGGDDDFRSPIGAAAFAGGIAVLGDVL